MLALAYISVHSLFAPYVLKSLVFRRFGMKKGLPDFSENPQGGVRGIRTLEPLNTTNTLAGCPYRPLRHVSMLHIGATTWHLTIVPRTSATRCAARGVIRGLTTGQRAGFESPVNVTITATISSATPAISRRPALRQARPRAGGKEIATAAPQPVRQGGEDVLIRWPKAALWMENPAATPGFPQINVENSVAPAADGVI